MGNNTSTDDRLKLGQLVSKDTPVFPCKNRRMPCKITDVYDGDTCTIMVMVGDIPLKTKLRCLGIDTPEKSRCGDHEKEAGKLVASYTEKLLIGRILDVELVRHDKYGGRILGHLYLNDEETLAQHLLSEGMATAYMGDKKKKWTDDELRTIITICERKESHGF